MNVNQANNLFHKSVEGALEHLNRMKCLPKDSDEFATEQMRCLQSLRMFSDNDDAIDAMYDADMNEMERRHNA